MEGCEELHTVDQSLAFLGLIVLAVLLSFRATVIQRDALCLTLAGDQEEAQALPPIFPIRLGASALIVGALGFFLCLAVKTLTQARAGDDPVALRSAGANWTAAVLVFLAGLIRLEDLTFLEGNRRQTLAADLMPE